MRAFKTGAERSLGRYSIRLRRGENEESLGIFKRPSPKTGLPTSDQNTFKWNFTVGQFRMTAPLSLQHSSLSHYFPLFFSFPLTFPLRSLTVYVSRPDARSLSDGHRHVRDIHGNGARHYVGWEKKGNFFRLQSSASFPDGTNAMSISVASWGDKFNSASPLPPSEKRSRDETWLMELWGTDPAVQPLKVEKPRGQYFFLEPAHGIERKCVNLDFL